MLLERLANGRDLGLNDTGSDGDVENETLLRRLSERVRIVGSDPI